MDHAQHGDRHATMLRVFDIVVGGAMLALAFVGIGASDIYGGGSQTYWSLIALGFALAAVAVEWVHSDAFEKTRGILRLALHWLGVIAAIQLVYLFIATGRLVNADDGLVNGAILALGTFLCGVYGNWRLLVIGAALGLAAASVALFEQYLWLLVATAIVALGVLLLISRWRSRSDLRRSQGLA